MKFDLALDPLRDLVRADGGDAFLQLRGAVDHRDIRSKRTHVPAVVRREAELQTGRESPSPGAGPPVLHAVVAHETVGQLLKSDAAASAAGQQDTLFKATLSDHDTLVVPAGALVVGNLEAPSVHVQGSVYGRVKATRGCLVVDRDASVHGMVHGAGTVVVAGQVRATCWGAAVMAHGNLRLARSARVWGAVHYTVIEIYEGALIAGALVALAHV